PYYDPPLLHPHHAPPPPHTPPLSLHDALPISPDHTCGRSWMPRQPLPQRAIGNPPQVQAPIIATTDHPGAVRAPVYIVDDGRERTLVPKEALICYIPHLEAMLIGSPGEQLTIRTPGHIQW